MPAEHREPVRGVRQTQSWAVGDNSTRSTRSRTSIGVNGVDNDNMLAYVEASASLQKTPSRSRRRMNRRASTGGPGFVKPPLNNDTETDNSNRYAQEVHLASCPLSPSSPGESIASGASSLGALSPLRSEGEWKTPTLKDLFSQTNAKMKQAPRGRMNRRQSLSSVNSGTSSELSLDLFDHQSRADQSRVSTTTSTVRHHSGGDNFHMSTDTLQFSNTTKKGSNNKSENNNNNKKKADKTDQLVESLVWFSFHTPRAVLEDLISHELELWRNERHESKNKDKSSNNHKKGSKARDYKMSYMRLDDDDEEDDYSDEPPDEDGGGGDAVSVSSLSDDGTGATVHHDVFDGCTFSESMLRLAKATHGSKMIKLPNAVKRESALLFVDMSGFTKLSTILDVESLSKVINSYFDMIVSEVIQYGGDILKFAGDAFFAEWRVVEDEVAAGAESSPKGRRKKKKKNNNPLKELNASLACMSNDNFMFDGSVPKLSTCVLLASMCAASIVRKFSDYEVMSSSKGSEAMLNVHCGVGVGNMVGLHVGDYKEDQNKEEETVELRREFVILGSPIDQVSRAAELATDGEVMASPEAILALAFCCDITEEQRDSLEPVCIASRDKVFFEVSEPSALAQFDNDVPAAQQPYESLRMHCTALNLTALARLHLQMALYVHPVIREDELALSAAIQAGKISQPTEAVENRHRAEAELRSVLTIFIKAIISPRITGMRAVDSDLFKLLCDIMHVTSRELDRYSGHLRQFIVDDKGVVLIATFGLRGSTFPNMISNNGLPAIFSLHRALKTELKVESRIGATFGKVYCGIVGGVRRHEFAVMGAPVNLAARLMSSKVNKGILVDEAVRVQADARYAFNSLPPVTAKGYDKPVAILEPIESIWTKKGKSSIFIGREVEKETITTIASDMLDDSMERQSSMVFLMGEPGMGKSALARSVVEYIKTNSKDLGDGTIIVAARSTSTETEQRIPLSAYKKIFMRVVHDYCHFDGTLSSISEEGRSMTSTGTGSTSSRSFGRFRCAPGMEQHMSKHSPIPVSGSGSGSGSLSPTFATSKTREQWGDVFAKKDKVSQSMREIGSMLQSQGNLRQLLRKTDAGKRFLPVSANLNSSTHHGVGDGKASKKESLGRLTPKPSPKESLGQSLHRISMERSASLTSPTARSQSMRGSLMRKSKRASSLKGKNLKTTFDDSSSHTKESLGESLHRISMTRSSRSQSMKQKRMKVGLDDSSHASLEASVSNLTKNGSVPYFEKLCWVCETIDFPYEYADIVGSQFLGLDGANPVTHVDGHIPTMDELSEFLALALMCLTEYADLAFIVLDDFQWVDTFSWKIFQLLSKKWTKLLLLCAARSHDKQALRRISSAANQTEQRMIEISLGPLDFGEIRQLIANVLQHDETAVTDSFCGDIFQRTGGLPVYVVQVLENIKRKKTIELDENGLLQWTEEGLKEKRAFSSADKTGVVMEETFLSRFDTLDVRVRKVLHTCAVLGLSFSLSDVVKVHPGMEEIEIEIAMEDAVEEMILVEHVEDGDEDNMSLRSGSTATGDSESARTRSTKSIDGTGNKPSDRFFQFSHAMWRQNVLTTMLKERKMELHRLIAEAMEEDILAKSDISRLLTLFDHWKCCGDFCKTARLALAVGTRLEEWDLSAQSLELYEDSLELAFDTVEQVESDMDNEEWMQVSAKPDVLDLVLRLHIRIGLCNQNLGDEADSIRMFEDAYNIIKTASKVPNSSTPLMMPIISSLCVLKLYKISDEKRTKLEQEKLIEKFVKEAIENGDPVHVGRALAMEACYNARLSRYDNAFHSYQRLKAMYDVKNNSEDMLAEYGRDFVVECCSEAVQWHYLCGKHEDAERQADEVIQEYLPLLKDSESDVVMYAVYPLVQVLKLIGRAKDAEMILNDYVVRPYQEGSLADFWEPVFSPLSYLLDLIVMEEDEEYDEKLLEEVESWVLDKDNHEYINIELEPKVHTILGEICWRLMDFKDKEDPARQVLADKAHEMLKPVATSQQSEVFLKNTAQALIESL